MNILEIKQTLHRLDIISRPYAVLINPKDYRELESELNTIKDKVLIQPHPFVSQGKVIVVDRETYELY